MGVAQEAGSGGGWGTGRDDHLTSASSGASFPALALRSFQTSNSPNLVPPGERWRKRALPGNAGARLGGRCLLDRVSFGRRRLAASAEGSSAAAAALGASTDPFLTLAEMRGHGVLPHRSTRKHSTPRPPPRAGTEDGLGAEGLLRSAPRAARVPRRPLRARENPWVPGRSLSVPSRSPPPPRACPRPISQVVPIQSPFPGFCVLRYMDAFVQRRDGGAGPQVSSDFAPHGDVPPYVRPFSTLKPQEQERLSNLETPLPDLLAPGLCPLIY